MSGIYIPDVGLPETNDTYCLFLSRDGTVHLWRGPHAMVGHEFKAFPVPDHGRLIDADFIVKHLRKQIQDVGEDTELANRDREFISIIGAVSTIIPSEREKS